MVIEQIRDDKLCSIVFECRPDAILVGGFIRDIILKTPSKDRDFLVVAPPDILAKEIHKAVGGTVVRLKEGIVTRVVTPEGDTIDFTKLDKDIEKDLQTRDLTINSIGYKKGGNLIDPTGGISDIERRVIRAHRKENLISDPVRIIRAYRFASQIEGMIEKKTRWWLKELKDLMIYSPKERITIEFIKILSGNNYVETLLNMAEDGILEVIFSCNIRKIIDLLEKLLELKGTFKVIPNVFHMNISGETLDLERLTVLMGLILFAKHDKMLIVLPYKLKHRVKRLGYAFNGKFDLHKETELFNALKTAWPAVFEYLILSGRGDLIGEAKRFSQLMRHPVINGKTIKSMRPELKDKEIGKVLDKTREEAFLGRLKNKEQIKEFIRNITIII